MKRGEVVISGRIVKVCRCCFSEQLFRRLYPELAAFKISNELCQTHFEILLATAITLSAQATHDNLPHRN